MDFDYPDQIDAMFNPEAVAVIGATEDIQKWGFGIINSYLLREPDIDLYLVNPNRDEIFGRKSYDSILDIPDDIDLAVITIPAKIVPDAVDECQEKGVETVIVISAGFSEAGNEDLAEEMVENARDGGVRIVGPNCMGHFDTSSSLYTARFFPSIGEGNISVISQSGNFGVFIVKEGYKKDFGFSKYITTGNEADLGFVDFLEYLGDDPSTDIIVSYIEEIRDGERFKEVAPKITKDKPLFVLKAGETEAGTKAAASHTGAMAGDDRIYDGVFKQVGAIRVETLEELFDTLEALQKQPLPEGKNVGILTGGGGFGVIAADACEKSGLSVPDLSDETMEKLDEVLPPRWSKGNPVDMVAAGALTYDCLPPLLKDENIDIILAPYALAMSGSAKTREMIPEVEEEADEFYSEAMEWEDNKTDEVIQLLEEHEKPLLAAGLPGFSETSLHEKVRKNLPTYPSPERAAQVLKYLTRYRSFLNQEKED